MYLVLGVGNFDLSLGGVGNLNRILCFDLAECALGVFSCGVVVEQFCKHRSWPLRVNGTLKKGFKTNNNLTYF